MTHAHWFCTSCGLYLYLCAEILLFQLHSLFISYIEVPSAEQLAGIPRVCLRVNEVPAEGFCHAAMKIKLVRCTTGKFIRSVQQGEEGDLSAFHPIPRLLDLCQSMSLRQCGK